MLENSALLNYANTIFINVNTSKFYNKNLNDILQIKKIRLHINKFKPNKTHFLYMSLFLYQKLPHLHNFYIPHKFRYQKQRIRRRHGVSLILNKKNAYFFFSKFLTEILPFSNSTENEAVQKIKNFWKITVWQAPLTNETYRLQSLHGYISTLPITISCHFTNKYSHQHLHFFNFFKIISRESLVKLNE